jgi:hypothetical protein
VSGRQRASTARAAFGRAMTPQAAKTAARNEPKARSTPAASDRPSKFTVLLDANTAADFDALAVQLRRQLGRRIEKAAIIRALVALAGDDAALRGQLASELRNQHQ